MTDSSQSSFDEWHARVPKSIRRPAATGLVILAFAFLGFSVWAGTAPINSAVVAHGKFIATGQNKIIQHLEGGIIHKILVKEGDVVNPGQSLVQLDDTLAKAQLRRLELKHYHLLAMQARLVAEHRSRDDIAFDDSLTNQAADPEVSAIIEGQKTEFLARREALASETAILRQRIAAIREEITGVRAERTAGVSFGHFANSHVLRSASAYGVGVVQCFTAMQ